jgi:hypothetical protein
MIAEKINVFMSLIPSLGALGSSFMPAVWLGWRAFARLLLLCVFVGFDLHQAFDAAHSLTDCGQGEVRKLGHAVPLHRQLHVGAFAFGDREFDLRSFARGGHALLPLHGDGRASREAAGGEQMRSNEAHYDS